LCFFIILIASLTERNQILNPRFTRVLKVLSSAVFCLLGIFTLSGYLNNGALLEQQQNELEKLRGENRQLRIENSILAKYKDDIEQIDARITDLKTKGYRPDKLLVRYIQKKSREMNIKDDFVINVLRTESSLWQFTNGALGELGGFQILPSTLYHYVGLFGIDSTQINLADYADLKTNTEWAYLMFLDMKHNKKRLEWKDWNTGFQEPVKTSKEKELALTKNNQSAN
jgi:hypothetical protein